MPPLITTKPFYTPVTSVPSVYRATVMADTPLHYWRFGDPDPGTLPQPVTDETGNFTGIYDGTLTFGRPGILPSDAGNATFGSSGTFGGVGISDAASLTPAGSFAIEGWIKMTSTPVTRETIISKEVAGSVFPEYAFYIDASMQLHFELFSQDGITNSSLTTSSTVLSINTLYHLVAVFRTSDTIPRIFINGAQDTVGSAWPFTVWNSTSDVGVGFTQGGTTMGASGDMQEYAYYDHDLSDARILAHYNAGI